MNERDLPPSVTSGPALLRQETASGGAKFQTMTRRSTRVRARIPILITSLDPTTPFSLPCETMLVNVHGCAARITQPLEIGMPVRLRVRDSREITARVVICQPVQGDQPCWVAGIELDKPGNIWGLTRFPEDWARFDQETEQSKAGEPAAGRSAIALKMPVWPLASPSAKAGFPAQAHEELKTQLAAHQQTITGLEDRLAKSMAALPGIIQRQLADAQRETLAQALEQFDARLAESLPQQSPVETEAIAQMQERLAAAESLLGRTRQQLADAHEQTQEQVRKQLGATLAESLKPLQEELAASRKKAEEAQQIGAAVAEQRNARDQQATARWQALETSAQTVQKELARAHEEVKTQLAAHQQTITGLEDRLAKSMAALPDVIQRQLADAQQETLAQALQQFDARLAESLPQQSPVGTEAIAQMQERLAAAESLLGRTRQQLADAHEQTREQVRKQLGATLTESLKPLQEELAACQKKAEEARQIGAGVAAQRNAQDQQTTARWQALETSAQTVQKELAQAHEELKTRLAAHQQTITGLEDRLAKSMAALPDVIQRQLADAQQETLAQALQQFDARLAGSLPQQSPKQTEAIVQMQERLAAAESLLGRTRQELADAHEQTQEQVRKQLGATLTESLKPLQEELAACQKKAEEARQIGAGVAAQRNAQDQQTTARWQALEASAQAVQKELAQARGLLESSTQGLTQRIQEPITAAVQEALAEARARISAELARESESLQEGGRSAAEELRGAADSLRSEREATMAQLAALDSKRAELQLWLTEQQAAYTRHVNLQLEQFTEQQSVYANGFREKLEQLAGELAARSLRMLEEKVRSDVEKQAERTGAEVRQYLDAMLERTSGLRQDALSLLDALQRENERCQTQMQALLNEKDTVDDWMRERAAEFRKTFHDALVETTGQIRGRLQMATEMMEQPLEKLRQQAAEQLQEQAGRQARHLREHADEVTERLRGLQRDIETAVRESLRAQAAETVATCGREIAEVAQRTVEEWRATLASNLESLTRLLGQPIPRDRQ